MAWKWPWVKSATSGAQMVDSTVLFLEHLEDLRKQVAAQQALIDRLVAQLAERDSQIRMVLEERFYRPVQTVPVERPAQALAPEDLNDVTQFDAGSDEEWLKRLDQVAETQAAKRKSAEGSDEQKS